MKKATSSGMSSRRSDEAGTRIGTTLSRWNRSSRKRPSAISAARSRAVDEMMRTSTWTRVVPPTRWKFWSTSTRRILLCVSRGMSATSSR